MRAVLMVALLLLAGAIQLMSQDRVPRVPAPATRVSTSDGLVSGRHPPVFWKRGMVVPGRSAPQTTVPGTATREEPVEHFAPQDSPERPLSRLTREQMVEALAEVRAGASRSQVVDRLGPPAYSIGIPEGGHYVERCRFRSGTENLATIEFRDGVMTAIDRAPR